MPALKDTKAVLSKYVVNLKGKKYLQVAGRVYSAHNARQLIGILTERLDTPEDNEYIIRATATVLNDHLRDFDNLPLEAKIGQFTGLSRMPKRGGNMKSAEGTNPLETCETSAVGRALGFAGFGDLESIASAEEVEIAHAIRDSAENDEDEEENDIPKPRVAATPFDVAKRTLSEKLAAKGWNKERANEEAKTLYNATLRDLTFEQVNEWINALETPEPELAAAPF